MINFMAKYTGVFVSTMLTTLVFMCTVHYLGVHNAHNETRKHGARFVSGFPAILLH